MRRSTLARRPSARPEAEEGGGAKRPMDGQSGREEENRRGRRRYEPGVEERGRASDARSQRERETPKRWSRRPRKKRARNERRSRRREETAV